MWRRRLTVYPWGMLETIEYDDRGIESVGLIAAEGGRSQTRTHVWTVESIRLRIEQERRTDGTVRWEPFHLSETASRAHRVPDVPARPNCMSGIALTEWSSPLR